MLNGRIDVNSLSWMIYLADVTGGLNSLAGFVGGGATIIFAVWPWRNQWMDDFHNGEGVRPAPKRLVAIALGAFLIAAILPSSSTIYAIAASEMGEKALNTQTGGKAVKALDAWLDRQITPEPSK